MRFSIWSSPQVSQKEYAAINGSDHENETDIDPPAYSLRFLRRDSSTLKISQIIAFILLGLSLGISSTLLVLKITDRNMKEGSKSMEFPGVPTEITDSVVHKVFNPDLLFDPSRKDLDAEQAWYGFRSRFVFVENPREHGLAPSAKDKNHPSRELYSVAAFHQLHCMGVIKYAWNTILDKGNTTLDHIYPGMEDAPEDESYTIGSHFSHCVEIVRQALECYADPTLEPLLTDTGDHSALLASGWGTKHTCRNFEKLTEWVDAPISD